MRENIIATGPLPNTEMVNKAFKGQFMKIETPNGFVEWTEKCSCHFDLKKAISSLSRCSRGFSVLEYCYP